MYGMLSGQQSRLPLFHPLQHQQQQQGLLNTHNHHHCSSLLKNSNNSSSSTACCKSSSVVCCCWESASASSGTVAGLLLEPTSVLDIRSPSPNNSRALSSSLSGSAAEAAVSSSTKAVSSSSSSSHEDCVGAGAAPADQELDEFRAGGLPVAELQQVYGLYEGQQQQQQGVLPLFYSGQGIRQIEQAIGGDGVGGIVGEVSGFEQRLGDFVRNGGAAAEWGSAGSSAWLHDLVLGAVDHHPRQQQQQQQLEELESELFRCPSSPPPPTDSSSLMRWLLGGDGPGAGATAGDVRNPWQQQQQQVMGMIVKQEQEAIHDQWSQHHHHNQPQPLGFHHPQSAYLSSSSIPPHLAHLESFTRRTLPLSSPHPAPSSASLYHSSPPVMEGLVDSKPFNPFNPYQQQQRDPFMAGMMQQQHSLFGGGGGGGGGLLGILGGSRPHSAAMLDYQVRPSAASPLHLVQQQQLRDLQAGLSSKRAFEEQQQQLLLRSQQQQQHKRDHHQFQGRHQQQYEHSSKLARLSPANAPTGHLLQQQQWSPGDDVGGRGSELNSSSFVNKLLVQAAEAFESGLDELAQSILARLNDHHHHHQRQRQQQQQAPASAAAHRIAFMFRDILLGRIADRKTRCPSAAAGETCSASASALEMFEQVGAFKSLCEASPVLKFAHFTANQAIAEAMEAEEQVHILDLSEAAAAPSSSYSSFGGQWSSYVMSSSQPHPQQQQQQQQRIRVTLVGTREESLCFAVESLQEFASGYYRGGTGFEFRGVLVEPGRRLDASELGILPGEAVAVNFVFGLHRMLLAEAVEPVLASVRGLNPKIVTLVERELDTGAPFASRFREGLDYYCSLAESLSSSSGGAMGQWDKVEQLVWKPEIEAILLGRQQHHKLQQWRARMGAAGFSCSRLSEACERQAECLFGSSSSSGGGHELVKDEDGSLLVGFQGKLLASASAWRCC